MFPKFDYLSPTTLSEALELLEKYGGDAKILAGGTDLLVDLRGRLIKPKAVIDIKNIPELRVLEYREGEGLRVGAAVTFRNILEHEAVKRRYGVLWEACETIGDPLLRNRATLVGNICNASPAADSAPALLVLEAKVKIVSRKGEREIPVEEFFTGVKKTALKPGELVAEVRIPDPPENARGRYLKAMRVWSEDLTVVGVAALVHGPRDKPSVRLAYASVAPTPIRVREAEKVFEKPGPLEKKVEEAAEAAARGVSPITDVRGGAEYRLNLVRVLTKRALRELLGVEEG